MARDRGGGAGMSDGAAAAAAAAEASSMIILAAVNIVSCDSSRGRLHIAGPHWAAWRHGHFMRCSLSISDRILCWY